MVCRNLSAFADAPRAGSAEAKTTSQIVFHKSPKMHPVQAAPRQRCRADGNQARCKRCTPCRQRRGKVFCSRHFSRICADAPRAGSAEAKVLSLGMEAQQRGCTPCRQRRGKVLARPRCHLSKKDAPRAGSAEAKLPAVGSRLPHIRCTPCRQRRGKDVAALVGIAEHAMHPCRQRRGKGLDELYYIFRGRCTPCRQRRGKEDIG